jgi:hypothetical protein
MSNREGWWLIGLLLISVPNAVIMYLCYAEASQEVDRKGFSPSLYLLPTLGYAAIALSVAVYLLILWRKKLL